MPNIISDVRLFRPPSPPLLWSLAAAHSQSARITPRSDLQGSNFEVQIGENIISTGLTPDPVVMAGLPDASQRLESSVMGMGGGVESAPPADWRGGGVQDHDCMRREREQPEPYI